MSSSQITRFNNGGGGAGAENNQLKQRLAAARAAAAARKKQTTPRGGGGKPSTKPPNKVPQRWKEPSGPEKAMEEWRSLMKKPGAAVVVVG